MCELYIAETEKQAPLQNISYCRIVLSVAMFYIRGRMSYKDFLSRKSVIDPDTGLTDIPEVNSQQLTKS